MEATYIQQVFSNNNLSHFEKLQQVNVIFNSDSWNFKYESCLSSISCPGSIVNTKRLYLFLAYRPELSLVNEESTEEFQIIMKHRHIYISDYVWYFYSSIFMSVYLVCGVI